MSLGQSEVDGLPSIGRQGPTETVKGMMVLRDHIYRYPVTINSEGSKRERKSANIQILCRMR